MRRRGLIAAGFAMPLRDAIDLARRAFVAIGSCPVQQIMKY